MQLGFDLSQKQTVKLAITAEMKQSITILQYSASELMDFLNKQATENPLIEMNETQATNSISSFKLPESSYSVNSFKNRMHSKVRKNNQENKDYDFLDYYCSNTSTLEDHLWEQISFLNSINEEKRSILQFLIGNLDTNGYLELQNKEIAELLQKPLSTIEEIVTILQSLAPSGIGARNLSECLLLQAQSIEKPNKLSLEIIKYHLHDLADMRYRKIAKIQRVTLEDIQEAADFIRTLNPRPASSFNKTITQHISPDIYLEIIDNELHLSLNDHLFPHISINNHYKDLIHTPQSDICKNYLKTKYHEAQLVLKGLEQRYQTLYRVTEAIVEIQNEFFLTGTSGLKAMTLYDIAEQLNVHESTVSRAINNKYIQTPYGLFPLKHFFARGLYRVDGSEGDSTITVKEKIKNIILNEDKKMPYSDQKLCEILAQEGIKISRRTIAKYREELRIQSSAKRKRF